ncbi:MAG TPA: dodecin domain-containing protein [Paraburkholderia sp.]|nr:dodecin domain-containing protein [Paraburkholderia sp.]HKR44461.1 dodecin domain-containing protein [Paraburkholderia sp.]
MTEIIGTSTTSWEEAAKNAVETQDGAATVFVATRRRGRPVSHWPV